MNDRSKHENPCTTSIPRQNMGISRLVFDSVFTLSKRNSAKPTCSTRHQQKKKKNTQPCSTTSDLTIRQGNVHLASCVSCSIYSHTASSLKQASTIVGLEYEPHTHTHTHNSNTLCMGSCKMQTKKLELKGAPHRHASLINTSSTKTIERHEDHRNLQVK